MGMAGCPEWSGLTSAKSLSLQVRDEWHKVGDGGNKQKGGFEGCRDCVFPMVHYTPTTTLSRKGAGQLSFTPQSRCVFNELIQMKKFNTMDGLPPLLYPAHTPLTMAPQHTL